MKNKEALEVLKSWLVVAYQNTDRTDDTNAELYEALSTVFRFINSQHEQVEKLQEVIFEQEETMQLIGLEKQKYFDELQTTKSKAIKEFAEKLKENIAKSIDNYWNNNANGYYLAEDVLDEIDILIKDMGR